MGTGSKTTDSVVIFQFRNQYESSQMHYLNKIGVTLKVHYYDDKK